MAEEIEELVVAAKPEGIEETSQGMEDLQGDMEEVSGEMEDTGAEMQGFSQQFRGALNAATAGLAVAAAGLLSQVPVLGETMSGLFSIVEAVAFQMDQVLRPALGPITDLMFDISDAIFEAEGPMGDLIGIAGTLGSVAAGLAGILTKTSTSLSAILSGSLSAAAALGALLGTVGVAILEILGINDAAQNLGDKLGTFLPDVIRDFLILLTGPFTAALAGVGAAILGFVEGFLEGGLGEGFDQAGERLGKFKNVFTNAWDNIKATVKNAGGDIVDFIKNQLPGDLSGGVSGVVDTLKGIGMGLWDTEIKPLLQTAFNSFGSWLGDNAPDLLTSGLNVIADHIKDNLPGFEDIKEVGNDIVGGLLAGFRERNERVGTLIGNIKSTITSVLPSFEDIKDIGEDIIDGLVQGIKDNIQDLKDAANDIAKVINDRVGVGSDTEAGPLSNFGSTPDNIVNTITKVGERTGEVATATNSMVRPLQNIDPSGDSGDGGQRATEDTVINLQIDGRDVGTATEGQRRDSLADRNING